jgi:hypothetical protein
MAVTFTASGAINNIPFPFSLVTFGTRPNDTGSANLIVKGENLHVRDYSGTNDNAVGFRRLTNTTDMFAESSASSTWKVADGQTHWVCTVSAAGAPKMYKNGTEVTYRVQTSGAGTLTSDAASDLVFNLNNVEHAAFYNIELSSAEVSSLYNGGAGVNCYSVRGGSILVSSDTPTSFGDTTNGSDTLNVAANEACVGKFTLSEAADVTSVRIYCRAASGTANVKGLIYADSAGSPGARKAIGSVVSVGPAPAAWYTSTVSVSLTPGDYWIGFVPESQVVLSEDTVGGAQTSIKSSFTYASPPDPFGTESANDDGFQVNVYATYVIPPGGGGGGGGSRIFLGTFG